MELGKCHLLFGCEIMKFFSTGLLLLIVFGSLEGSTIPHKRTVRALNATIQTHFNGTIQRRNPCTDKEVERSSYRGCHEFHHHSKESNWSDYSRKCATLISDFFHAISNLVTFKDRQSGTFDLNINTKVSHKTDGACADTKTPICPTPTVIVESTDCEVRPSTRRDDLPRTDAHSKSSEICSLEDAVKVDEEEEEKCSVDSEASVNEESQTADSSLLPENDVCLDVSSSGKKIPEPSDKTIPALQPAREVNFPEIKQQSEEFQPETIPSLDQTSETTNIESSAPNTYDDKSTSITVKPDSTVQAPSTVNTSAPKEDLYIDISETPQQSTATNSLGQETPSDSKDYLSDYTSQTNEEKTETQPSSSATQSENDKVDSEYDAPSIEFSDKIALYNVHEPQQKAFQTISTTTQHYSSDTTTPSTFEIQSDYDVHDMTVNTQATSPPQYQSESYDEQIQSSQAATFAPFQPEPENYVNQYDQVASDLPTSSPPKDEGTIEFSDQLAVYNVRQPQPESPSSSSLMNEPTSIQPPSLPQSQSENYVNYEDELVSNQLPTSVSPPKGEEPSVEFSDQLAIYNVRQPYLEPTSIQPASSEPQPGNYDSYEDETESNESITSSPPSVNAEPSIEFSDELAVYNIRTPTTTAYPPSSVSLSETTSTQPSVSPETQTANYVNYEDEAVEKQSPTIPPPEEMEPSIEFSDQLAVYNVREQLPGTTTPYPLVTSSIQSSASQSDNYMNYESDVVSNQTPTSPAPQLGEDQYLEYSDQLAVYNVREPLPGTTIPYPLVTSSIQSSASQSDNYMNYESDVVSNQTPTSPSPQLGEDQYLEYSDQLAVYNVREPLPGTTTPYPLVTSSIQSSASQSDNYMNYESDVVSNQTPTTSSPQHGEDQYLEYSDQLAVYNVREPLPSTTTSSPAVNENIPSSFGTTLPPLFSSYELDTYDDQKTEIEPQPTSSPKFEEETYNFQPVTSQPQPSNEPATDYYAEYNAQTFSNQMLPFTTPVGNVYPTMTPSSEYIDSNGPESPSSDYSSSEGIGGFVSTSLPSSSEGTSSFNNFELQYDSQPTPTQLPSEAQQDQVFSDQVSDIREPQSDSSVSDEPISDVVTAISPITESESSNSYKDESSLTDYQQTIPSELQTETSVTNDYPESSSPNQPLPKSYDIYDEQSSTSENEAPTTSVNEPTTYSQIPIDVITTSPSSTEPENFGIYDESQFSAEPQRTYPPKTENESFTNYEDNNTSITPQDSVSIEPLSDNDSSENEPISNQEGFSSEEDGNVTVSNDQGPLPLSPNTFRPTVEIDTTVNYADQTPFRPIRLPSSFGPLQENNIIYDEGILGNETEPSALGGEEANNFLNVSSELTKQNEGKEFDSQTTLAPKLEFDTYYEETFKQPSSDSPKINNYMIYEDDMQPSSPKIDLNMPAFFPSTPSFTQEIITTPSTPEAMPETYTDYEYSKTDFNSQATFPPQTESVIYDDHSSQDQSLTQQQQQQSVDYAVYDNRIQSTSTSSPPDQEMIEFTDQLSIYNVPETVLESSSPSLSELISSSMTTTTQSTIPSDRENLEIELQPTFSPSVEPQSYDEQSLPSKDLNVDTYINYEDTISSSPLQTTTLPPNEVEPSLEYSDQLAVYNVRQPQPESPSSSSLMNEPTSVQPPSLPQSQSENYVNYEDELVSNQLPTSVSPPKGEEPSVEFSDQLAIYNVRQPYLEPTSIQPASSEPQPGNYDSYEDETESSETTTLSSTGNVEQSSQYSDEVTTYNVQSPLIFLSPSPQLVENIRNVTISTLPPSPVYEPVSAQTASSEAEPESEEDYEDEIVSNDSLTTLSPPKEPSIEFSDELAIYNIRQTSTASPLSYVSSIESSSAQPSIAPLPQQDNYVSYEDERTSNQIPTTSSPQHEEVQYLEYSDQLAVYNVREPLPGTTTPYPLVTSSIPSSASQPDNYMNYESDVVSNQTPTSPSPQLGEDQYLEYSDQLAVYNVREPLPSTTTSSPAVNEDIPNSLGTTLPPLFSSNRIETYDDQSIGNELQPTVAPETYDEPTSAPATSFSPTETQPENYVNYETEELPTSSSSPKSVEPFLEYSDQLSIYDVHQPEHYSSSPSPVNENLVTTTAPVEYTDSQPTFAPESEPQMYDEPISFPAYSVSQPDVHTNYDDEIVSNEFPTSPYPPHGVEPSLELNSQLASSSIAPSSSSSTEEAPFLQYSDQVSNYNDRQPDFETTPSSPSEIENVPSGAMSVSTMIPLPSGDSIQDYNSPLTSSDYVSTPSFQVVPDSQVTYEDDTVPEERLSSTSSTFNLAHSQDYSVPPSNDNAEQGFDYQSTSPSQSKDNYITYKDQTVSNAQTTSSPETEVEPSLEYSDQLAIYNVREPVLISTAAPVVSESIPSSITTLPPSSLIHELTSPQPFPSECDSESDSGDDYEDEEGSNEPLTTLSTPAQTEPSVEYSDQLAAFNVLGPVIVPISAPVEDENVPSGDVTTSLPSSESDSSGDYEDESVSTTPPMTGYEPSLEVSDELSIYNVRQRPSELTTPSPLSENMPSGAVTTFAPSLPSDKYESYDYQPVGFESQSTYSPKDESQVYYPSTSVPNTPSQPQDNYVNYENEIESNEPMITLRPSVDVEPSLEYSDELAVYNVRSPLTPSSSPSPLFTENTAVDTVSTFMPTPVYDEPTSAPSITPEEQPDAYINYEDQLPSNKYPTTYSPTKVEPSMISSDQISINTTNAHSLPSDAYHYESHVEFTDYTTIVPSELPSQTSNEPTSIGPLPSSKPQPEQYVNYEDETILTPFSTSTSPPIQVEPSLEYSDQLAVYNVREPLFESTSPPVVSQNFPSSVVTTLSPSSSLSVEPISIQPSSSESQSESDDEYEDETESNESSTTLSTPVQVQVEPSVEYSDQLAVYNVREPISEPTSPPVVSENIPSSVVTTLSPSSSNLQSDSYIYEDYKDETVSKGPSSTLSTPVQVEPSLEYSDQLAIYNVRQPDYSYASPSPFNENYSNEVVTTEAPSLPSDGFGMYDNQVLYTDSQPTSPPQSDSHIYDEPKFVPVSSESQPDNYVNYEDKIVSNQVSFSPSTPVPSLEYSDQLAVYNVREPTSPPAVATAESSTPLSAEPISIQPSSSDSQSDSDDDEYDDESVTDEFTTTLSTPVQVQVEPSVEYSDELAVYNVREPISEPTSPPVVSENIPSSVVTTLLPSSSLIAGQTSPQSSSSDTESDYEDETVSTISPVTGYEPSLEVSDELSIYNVRQRPSEMTTPSPFNNNVLNNIKTTISPFFTFKESSLKDTLNTASQTTVPPEYEYDSDDEGSSIQPSQSNEVDSQALSNETTSKDFLPETLSNSDEQTISNVIQSTPSPDLSNQLYSENEVEFQEVSFTTARPNVESSVISESKTSPSYSTLTLPSSEVITETYTDYEGSTADSNSPSTPYDEPRNPSQVQTSTLQPQIVNYDYYNDQTQKPEESPASPPTTEIETKITLTEVGPTLPPSFESQIFDKPNPIQPDNYVDYEDSTLPNQMPTSSSPQLNIQPSIEFSDELAVYNVRKPYFETTSIQPSSEPQLDSYDTYEDQVIVNELSTPSPHQKVENTAPQPSSVPEGETQMYDEPTSSPAASSEPQTNNYVNYDNEMFSNEPMTSTPSTNQVEPSLEYSDQLAVYNVREPLFEPTSPPVVSQNFPSSVVTTLSPSSSLSVEPISIQPSSSESQSESDDEYEDETESNESSTTLSTPVQVQVEPSVEYSDQLAVYNVREPISEPTSPPVVATAEPFPPLSVEPISVQPSSTDSQSDSDDEYDDEGVTDEFTTTLSTPVQVQVEPSVEYSDELAVYNVREPLLQPTSPPVVSQNIANNAVTTLSPSPDTQADSDEDYEDETVSTISPVTGYEPSLEVSDELSIYNVRQRPSEMITPSPFNNNVISNLMTTISPYFTSPSNEYEDSTLQSSVIKEAEPEIYDQSYFTSLPSSESLSNYVNSENAMTSDDYSTPISPPTEAEQSWSSTTPFEYSEQLSVYNVHQRPSELSSSSLLTENSSDDVVTTAAPPVSSNDFGLYDIQNDQNDEPKFSPEAELKNNDDSDSTQNSSSVPQPDNYVSYEDERTSNQIPTTSSPQHEEVQYLEYSDQLAVYNVREPLPGTTTPYPLVTSSIQSSASQSDNYMNYESDIVSNQTPTSPSPQLGEDQYLEYSDQLAVYNVREPFPSTTTSSPPVNEDIPSSTVTNTSSLPFYESETETTQSSFDSQPGSYQDYEGEILTTVPPYQGIKITSSKITVTTAAPSLPSEEYKTYDNEVEYTDSTNIVPTELPSQTSNEPTSIGPLPSSKPQPEQYVNYEDETISTPFSTSTSPPIQVEPSLEYSDQLAIYNVREPLLEPTSPPVVSQNFPSSVVTTLSPSSSLSVEPISIQPSSSESQSESDDEYEDETESNESSTTLSTPVQVQVEPSVEYSDQLAVYNVREPISESTSPPVVSENIPSSVVTTLSPSSSNLQSDSYIYEDYKDETVSKGPSSTLSTPVQVEPSVEYSDQLAIYNVRQPEYLTSPSPLTENLANDVVSTVTPSLGPGGFETYDNQVIYTDFQPTSSPQSDSQIFDEPTSIPASSSESQTDYYLNYEDKMASNVFTTLPPFTQSLVTSEQNDFYTYDDRTQSSDSQTTFSPETETDYYEAATTLKPQSPFSTQPLLETMVTTFQPRTEPQINKTENKTSTPSKQQEVSTFPPLYPLNQPSYSLPGESKLVSEQQDQVMSNQVVNSPPVPSSELDSDKQSNNFSNLVKSQETRLIDGVENARRDTPQPEPFALVPDQTNPSNEPGEDYVSCTCTRGNKTGTQHALMCPFNPVLKGNMTAPSYYILISKLPGGSDNQSQPDEERFQVEKVYLGDGTPLNCTDERKPFPTSKYTPVPISSARTVKLPIRLNNA